MFVHSCAFLCNLLCMFMHSCATPHAFLCIFVHSYAFLSNLLCLGKPYCLPPVARGCIAGSVAPPDLRCAANDARGGRPSPRSPCILEALFPATPLAFYRAAHSPGHIRVHALFPWCFGSGGHSAVHAEIVWDRVGTPCHMGADPSPASRHVYAIGKRPIPVSPFAALWAV